MYSVKVPGSLMLFGEHSVLHNKEAISTAINRYVNIELTENNNKTIVINSDKFGKYETNITNIKVKKPFDFVLEAILLYKPYIKHGITFNIKSDFSATLGLGSSAAVTVAIIFLLQKYCGKKINQQQLFDNSLQVIKKVQGFGSGADVAASILGGVVLVHEMKTIATSLPLTVIYSGLKEPTVKIVHNIADKFKNIEKILHQLYDISKTIITYATMAIENNNFIELGKLFNMASGLHESLGLYNQVLYDIICSLRNTSNIYGAKISGAGLGDCVVGIGNASMHNLFPMNHYQRLNQVTGLSVEVSSEGITESMIGVQHVEA